MSTDQLATLVVAASEAVVTAECALDAVEYPARTLAVLTALSAIRTAKATLTALAGAVEEILPPALPEPPEDAPATDDPETCGHPETWDVLGQIMCRTCGASQTPEGWKVL